jgi:glycosyltransferase involved in cell wall biosynthesis
MGEMTRAVEILFCVPDFATPLGEAGAEHQARLQAEELVRRGFHVRVLCCDGGATRTEVINGVQVIRLRCSRDRPGGYFRHAALVFDHILRHARATDLVHVHIAHYQADAAVTAAALTRIPSYVKVASSGTSGEVLARSHRRVGATRYVGLRRASRVQALSADVERELIEAGVPRDHIVRIPNGVDLDAFCPPSAAEKRAVRQRLGLPVASPIVLYAGRFARYKGAGDLVEAWRSIDRGDTKLVMVGTLDTEDSIGTIPSLDGLLVRRWTKDVVDYMRAADVFVHPARADGMSNAVLEAMATGLPVVHAASGAARGFLTDGSDALLFTSGDPAALRDALKSVLRDAPLRASLGEAARRRANDFSLTSVVDRITGEYARLLAGSQAAANLLSAEKP